ncbi:laminin subunit alpha-4 [Eucyclogobius newberryi]|uniref:laminin subunit alpha-4 n=1 Tax=Eucyclogobius newberryi TaxID=166745 RepID=UPI003B5AC1F6
MAARSLAGLSLLCILSGISYGATAARIRGQQQSLLKVCGKGFFLSERGFCLPCNCKGNADHCQDITGVCNNCKNHSTGDFCEHCEDSFILGVGPNGRRSCQPCACPLAVRSNSFAVHCDKGAGSLRCKCQEGYAGHSCERCAPGYFGNPMVIGSSCKRCDCSGNSDPNLIFNECHNVTGYCQHCWGNTAGAHCERCASGFYGDAITAKNCRECECNKCGTSSCDDRTGVCHCKPGVTGRICDQCEDGYSGFSSCQGCRRCECGAASLRSTCHPLTHSCPCRPGAGGRYCERCLPGYWDYGASGCQKCECESGYCDMHTGECLLEATINLCNSSCDECTWSLIRDLHLSNKTLDQLKVALLNISSGAAAHDRIKYYNYTALRLQVQFTGWEKRRSLLGAQTDDLETATGAIVSDMELLEESDSEVSSLSTRLDDSTLQTLSKAELLTSNLSDLNLGIEDMIHDWELYSVQQEQAPEVVQQNTELAQGMVAWMRALDLSPREPRAKEESTMAHELLRRVRQQEKKLGLTDSRLPTIRELLSRFSTQLSHAHTLLQRAASTTQQTQDKNRVNVVKYQRNEAKQRSLADAHDSVNKTLVTASEHLSHTENTVGEVNSMVQNMTQYHAAIDGAEQKLQDKSERLANVDTELVLRADEHAEQLDSQANALEEDLRESDTNGFVQRAISAANVYNNIIKYIHDANITSRTTFNLSQKAEQDVSGINTKLSSLVTQSDHVFKESVSLHSEQSEVKTEVVDKLNYIQETRDTMEKNNKKLEELGQDIGQIYTDRTPQRLNFTLEVAEETLNHSKEVLQTITPISNKVEQWANNMKKKQYSTEAYESAVDSAGEAVENLNILVPELLDKLRVVEQKKPVNNVTTNILRIRELIAQARSVAKKVQVSMKFNGQSAVEVHPHTSLDDLKTVTTISLFIRVDPDKDPIEDRFILYLGDRNGRKDYMGLAIKNDNLVYVYNLGGEDVEIPLGSKPVSQWPAVFNYVKVERLGRHGKVFLTIPSQSSSDEQKFIQKGQAPGTDSLFDVDPNDIVFFVGGVPAGVKLPPPLSLAPFVGCIELESINNDVISLYNFKETHQIDVIASAPCPRYKLAFSQSRIASYLFDGTGYALINNIERRGKFGVVTRFDISVRTVANDGVLLLMVNGLKFFLLELKNGYLRLIYDFGFSGGPNRLEEKLPVLQINDAKYHEVSLIYHQSKKVILLVDKGHVKSIENPKTTLPFSNVYIGGVPSSVLKASSELAAVVGLKGCVKGFQFQKKDFNLLEEPGTIGISSGCPEESFMSRKAYFTGESYLGSTAKTSPFDSFEGGLNFRTVQPSGLLFYHREGSDEFSITLENGGVVLNNRGTKVKSHKKQYSDGRTHFIVASVNNQKYSLMVDDKDKQEKKRPASASRSSSDSALKSFYFGGSPDSSLKNFTGCISYAYISRLERDIEPEDFQKYPEKMKVSLQECPVKRPPAALQSQEHRKTRGGNSKKESIVPEEHNSDDPNTDGGSCSQPPIPPATEHTFQYGGFSHSRHQYPLPQHALDHRWHLSLSLRTVSSSGLMVYVCDTEERSFIALYLADGRLELTFSTGEEPVRLRSQNKYNDGKWHSVVLIGDGNLGRLIIDGLTLLETRAPKNRDTGSLQLHGPLYVGGVPTGKAQRNVPTSNLHSIQGCFRNLQLDGKWLPAPDSFGVVPCFSRPLEEGTYFSAKGGHIVLDESFHLGLMFELQIEVRPRVDSGLLLHVRSVEGYFSLFLHQAAVIVLVNDGTHEFFTKVVPKHSLCAGTWHIITVIRKANVVQLAVDSEVNHVVGPQGHNVDHSGTVWIGGAPESELLLPDSVGPVKPYVGCMRGLSIDGRAVNFSKVALVQGAVSARGCPA